MIGSSRLVSVIVPVYNGRKTVERAVSSVLSGTHANVQIVICDDASTDGTYELLSAVGDPRITLLRNLSNLGPGMSRERAIMASAGTWITFLDCDDCWTPSRLEALLSATDDDPYVVVFDDIMMCHQVSLDIRPFRRVYGRHAFGATEGKPVDVTPAQWASSAQFVMQPLIHRLALTSSGVHHTNRGFQEDTEFFLRLISSGFKLRYVPQANYLYRITPGSLSSTSRPGAQTRAMLEEILPLFVHDEDMRRALQRKIDYRRFTSALRSGRVLEALRLGSRDPSFPLELIQRVSKLTHYHCSRLANGAPKR